MFGSTTPSSEQAEILQQTYYVALGGLWRCLQGYWYTVCVSSVFNQVCLILKATSKAVCIVGDIKKTALSHYGPVTLDSYSISLFPNFKGHLNF